MDALINEKGLINARDLHSESNVKTRFNDWINKCIDICGLQKNKDFYYFRSKSTGGRPRDVVV